MHGDVVMGRQRVGDESDAPPRPCHQQDEEAFGALLGHLKTEEVTLAEQHGRRVPLVVKIAPDLDAAAVDSIARLLVRYRIDGVIATNTTIERERVRGERHADEPGGLSGKPLHEKSTAVIRALGRALDGALPIIGAGGIFSGTDACVLYFSKRTNGSNCCDVVALMNFATLYAASI